VFQVIGYPLLQPPMPGNGDEQQQWGYGQAIRAVVDENFLLGAIFPFQAAPHAAARWLLLFLFLTCAVLVQYADLAMGPICVREYLEQCPPYDCVARHGIPTTTITMAPPDVDVPENVNLQNKAGTASDKSEIEKMHDGFGGISNLLGREYDCKKPMCDLFYPQMIDYISLVRLTNVVFGKNSAHNIPTTDDAVITGYCKCTGPIYDGIVQGQVSNGARSIVVTAIVQTIVPKVFRAVFVLTSGDYEGCRKCFMVGLDRFMTGLLLVVVIVMMVFIFLVEFDPRGWRNAAAITALNLAILQPILAFLKLAVCIKAGWPLRSCGFKPPKQVQSDRPLYVCCPFSGTSSGKEGFGKRVFSHLQLRK